MSHSNTNAINVTAEGEIESFKYVVLTGTGNSIVKQATATTDKILGISYGSAEDGDALTVYLGGQVEVLAGETIAIGDLLTTDTNGAAIIAVETATDAYYGGMAMSSGVVGDRITVSLFVGPTAR